MRSMLRMLEWETMGQTARFERFIADLMRIVATGAHIDPDVSPRFSDQLDRLYANPFEEKKKRQPQTAAEIREYVICLLEGREWI